MNPGNVLHQKSGKPERVVNGKGIGLKPCGAWKFQNRQVVRGSWGFRRWSILIQQALLQVLQPLIDPTFSESSYGVRPGRSAHDAVLKAQQYAQEGYRVVVDVDLEKFFDLVSHDILMDRLAKRIAEQRVVVVVVDGGVTVALP